MGRREDDRKRERGWGSRGDRLEEEWERERVTKKGGGGRGGGDGRRGLGRGA